MARIRLLVPVAGHLADGIPAPSVGEPVEVDEATADSWCDGERAERVDDDPEPADVEAVHVEAQEYLAAVLEQHEAELAAVHADAQSYLAAVLEQHQAELAAASKPTRKKPAAEPVEPAPSES